MSSSVETVAGPVLGDMIPKILSDLLHVVGKHVENIPQMVVFHGDLNPISRIHKRITSTQNSCDGQNHHPTYNVIIL